MKAILELEVTMREQAESRAKNTQDHDVTIKKRKMPKIVEAAERKQVQQQQQATQRPQRKSVVQQVANIKPEIKTDSQPVKTSVIMSTPEFNQRHKSTPPEHPPKSEQTNESVICVNAPRSPDIVKKETIRDPVTDFVEKKSPPENEVEKTTTKIEKNEVRRPQEKIRLNSFLMDEAVTTLLDMSKT